MKTILLALAAFTIASSALAQTAAPAKHKVVLQMNVADNDSWNQLLGNIGNVQTAFRNDGGVQIEVVLYGKGLTALLKTIPRSRSASRRPPRMASPWPPARTQCG